MGADGRPLLAFGPSVSAASPGSAHTAAGAPPAPAPRRGTPGIAALALRSGVRGALRACARVRRGPGSRGHSDAAHTAGRLTPRGSLPVLRAALAPRARGAAAGLRASGAALRVRARSAARRGEDSGDGGGGGARGF